MNSYSSLKVFYHKDRLDALKEGELKPPLYVRLKPTNICNQHCAYCTYGSGETNNRTENRNAVDHRDVIPWEKMKEILSDFGKMGVRAITLSGGGEPLTYPQIVETVQIAESYDIDISLISNGQLLSGNIAEAFYRSKWVRVSFDSSDEGIYCGLRNVTSRDFKTVCNNIESFAGKKNPDCVLGINYVISERNASNVYDAAKYLKGIGVDNVKFAAVVSNRKEYHDGIKKDVIKQIYLAKKDFESDRFKIINNYEKDCDDKQFKPLKYNHCYTCRLVTTIGADQKVYLCHTRAYEKEAEVGSIKDKRFYDLWTDERTKEMLESINPEIQCKNFCAYQERNELINAYFDVYLGHINFI